MSEATNNGVYLVQPLGANGARLTLGSDSVDGLMGHLNALDEVDPVDGVSVISILLDRVETLNAAVLTKFGVSVKPVVNPGTPSAAPSAAPSCEHGPMRWKEGISRSTQKPYKGWFCTAPFGQAQCQVVWPD